MKYVLLDSKQPIQFELVNYTYDASTSGRVVVVSQAHDGFFSELIQFKLFPFEAAQISFLDVTSLTPLHCIQVSCFRGLIARFSLSWRLQWSLSELAPLVSSSSFYPWPRSIRFYFSSISFRSHLEHTFSPFQIFSSVRWTGQIAFLFKRQLIIWKFPSFLTFFHLGSVSRWPSNLVSLQSFLPSS